MMFVAIQYLVDRIRAAWENRIMSSKRLRRALRRDDYGTDQMPSDKIKSDPADWRDD